MTLEIPTFEEFFLARERRIKAEKNKKYFEKNRSSFLERDRKHYEKNKDWHLEKSKRYYEQNQSRMREVHKNYNKRKREELASHPCTETCEICGYKPEDGKILFFDHCHKSGKFRGWLCRKCNLALGYVNDDIKRLESLIRYLKERGV